MQCSITPLGSPTIAVTKKIDNNNIVIVGLLMRGCYGTQHFYSVAIYSPFFFPQVFLNTITKNITATTVTIIVSSGTKMPIAIFHAISFVLEGPTGTPVCVVTAVSNTCMYVVSMYDIVAINI